MKIFGIGWPKTGTTTLEKCFRILRYSHKGYSEDLFDNLDKTLRVARQFSTFQDLPWYLYYKELDHEFPGSKFVLTTRDSKRWLRSYRNAVEKQKAWRRPVLNSMRQKIYGFSFSDIRDAKDEQIAGRYERHNSDVKEHFLDRPGDLLVVNWENGDGWDSLCAFLKRPVPPYFFPHENKGHYS